MFGLVGKDFAAMKRGWRGGRVRGAGVTESCRSRGQCDAWIIRFPAGRHCAIEIYVGGHTWSTIVCGSARVDTTETRGQRGKRRRFRVRVRNLPADFKYPSDRGIRPPVQPSLWTLRINRVASLLLLSNSILRSAAHRAGSSS